MPKTDCDIIKDLLPLYADEVCSTKSGEVVTEHLLTCENCSKLYKNMQEGLPDMNEEKDGKGNDDDLQFMKSIKKELTFRQVIAAGIVIILALLLWFIPSEHKYLHSRISTDYIHITELYELENGNIYLSLESDKAFTNISLPMINAGIAARTNQEHIVQEFSFYDSLSERLKDSMYLKNCSIVFPVTERYNAGDQMNLYSLDQLCYIGKSEERLLIWEKGMDIPSAPESIEKRVADELSKMDESLDYGTPDQQFLFLSTTEIE